jgi:arabinose-5-phosphate isomerase
MKSRIAELLVQEAEAVKNIPVTDEYEKAIAIISDKIHKKGGKLITSGMGKAGQIALNIATTFSSTGTPSVFLHPSEAQHGDLGIIQPNDVMLLISNSGKTREIIELYHLSKRLNPDLQYIGISGCIEGEFKDFCDAYLWTGNPTEVGMLGLCPTTSTTVMNVIGNALVAEMMHEINFTNEEYSKRHHGGYLGDKSRKMTENSSN